MFDSIKSVTHIKRGIQDLPRSLVIIPEGARKGIYLLLKTHGGVKEVGIGTYNTATLALSLNSGEMKIFRSGKESDISPQEVMANVELSCRNDIFGTGTPVKYDGPYRIRHMRSVNEDKSEIFQEKSVKKIGFIMEFFKNGDLFDQSQKLNLHQKIHIIAKCANSLSYLHKTGLVHLDFKFTNVFLDGLDPKISDFGFVKVINMPAPAVASLGYLAPEMVEAILARKQYLANPKSDIWALGISIFSLIGGCGWNEACGQMHNQPERILTELPLIKKVAYSSIFSKPDFTPHHRNVLMVIDGCLQLNPELRPTGDQVALRLYEIYNEMSGA